MWGYFVLGQLKKHDTLSIPGYMEGAMHEYQQKPPTRPQHAPLKWEIPDYGEKLSGQKMRVTHKPSNLKTGNIYKRWQKNVLLSKSS